jgi:multisubunit Na+/H+ antiporter MnhG subunit
MPNTIDILFTLILAIIFMFCLTVTSSMVVKHVTVKSDIKLLNKNRFDNKL